MPDRDCTHGCKRRRRLDAFDSIGSSWMTLVALAVGGAVALQAGVTRGEERPTESPPAIADDIKGSLVIIGGAARYDHEAIWGELLRLATRPGSNAKPRIAVLACASSAPVPSGQRAVEVLRRHGADAFFVPIAVSGLDINHREAAEEPALVEEIRRADGVYFTGGAQGRICQALVREDGTNSAALDAIWHVYRRGGVVAGTSAGAAVMSRVMIREAGVVLNTMLNGMKMGREIDKGLGFLDPNWFIDQHCLVRGRFARALVAMQEEQVKFGIGIDEDSAIVVEGTSTARVIGIRGVIMLDISEASQDDATSEFNIRNARISYLNHGDSIDLRTRAITPAAEKVAERKIDPNAPGYQPGLRRRLFYNDILANSVLVDVLTRVIDHKDGLAIGMAYDGGAAQDGATTGFEFRFYRGVDSLGWESYANGITDSTIQNIHLDVRPVLVRGPVYVDPSSSPTLPNAKPQGVVAGTPAAK